MNENIIPGEVYRHFKGNLYQIVTIAKHSETLEDLVIYQALYGDFNVYARPINMFCEKVDKKKHPEAKQEYRFEKVDRNKVQETKEEKTVDTTEAVTEVNVTMTEPKIEEINVEGGCNAYLMEFLEAETIREKKEILKSIRNSIDDRLINDIAASMDIVIDEGPIDSRYMSLLSCLNTMSKYECDRFR